jgi:hypothetical protein
LRVNAVSVTRNLLREGNYRMRLYIAYKYSANNVIDVLQNIGKAIRVGHETAQIREVYPFVPHLDCLVAMQEPALPLEYYYNCSIAYLAVCDAMLLVDANDLHTSKGVLKEFEYCQKEGKMVFYSVGHLKEWLGYGSKTV